MPYELVARVAHHLAEESFTAIMASSVSVKSMGPMLSSNRARHRARHVEKKVRSTRVLTFIALGSAFEQSSSKWGSHWCPSAENGPVYDPSHKHQASPRRNNAESIRSQQPSNFE